MLVNNRLLTYFLFQLAISTICTTIYAQNLVPNGSFENNNMMCPSGIDNIDSTAFWYSPSTGIADYFTCPFITGESASVVGVPDNFWGSQTALSDTSYAGFVAYGPSNEREHLAVKLSTSLVAGKDYCVNFYVSLADFTGIAVADIGAFFSTDSIKTTDLPLNGVKPQILHTQGAVTNKQNWVNISGTFTAQENYEWLVIGNFFDNAQTTITDLNAPGSNISFKDRSFYYIDSVSVKALDDLVIELNEMNIKTKPEVAFFCIQDTVSLTVTSSPNSQYEWTTLLDPFTTISTSDSLTIYSTNLDSLTISSEDGGEKMNILVDQDSTKTFIVTIRDETDCSNCVRKDTITFDIIYPPIIKFTYASGCSNFETLLLDGSVGLIPTATYNWYIHDADTTLIDSLYTFGGASLTFPNPTPETDTFVVALEIVNINNCASADTILVAIQENCDVCFIGPKNLVLNPSMEILNTCPDNLGHVDNLLNWHSPTEAKADAFHKCSDIVSVPRNPFGSQQAALGNGYLGFLAYNVTDEREYVSIELTEALEENQPYCVSFKINLADKSGKAIDNIGLHFSSTKLANIETTGALSIASPPYLPQVINPANNIITDKENWVNISSIFTPTQSDLQWMTIGNFYTNDQTTVQDLPGQFSLNNISYYYLDDVLITKLPELSTTYDPITNNGKDITLINDTLFLCIGEEATVRASSDFCSYAWTTLGGPNTILLSTDSILTLSSETVGVKNFIVYAKFQEGCILQDTITVSFNPVPQLGFDILENCAGAVTVFVDTSSHINNDLTYEWFFGDGESLTNQSGIARHLYEQAGDYEVKLIITDNQTLCIDSTTVIYTVNVDCDPCNNQNNLVSNASFEDFSLTGSRCPTNLGQISQIDFWEPSPNIEGDAFSSCNGDTIVGVPKNIYGFQEANSGNSYGGFIAYDSEDNDNQSFIQAKLGASLQIGEAYCLKMYVALADSSRFATNQIGCYLSTQPADPKNLAQTPQLLNAENRLLSNFTPSNNNGWIEITNLFVADSAYEHILLGHFKDEVYTSNITDLGEGSSKLAYYYVDDVSIAPLNIDLPADTITTCQGEAISIMATTNTCNYYWIAADDEDNILSSIKELIVRPNVTTTYFFIGNNGNCTIQDSIVVEVIPKPELTIFNAITQDLSSTIVDTTICKGSSINLSATTEKNSIYLWTRFPEILDTITNFIEIPDTLHIDTATSIAVSTQTFTPDTTTVYHVMALDLLTSCKDVKSFTIKVAELPIANAGADTIYLCFQDTVLLQASGGTKYVWTTEDSTVAIDSILSNDSIATPRLSLNEPTTVQLFVTVANDNNCTAKDSIIIITVPPYQTPATDTITICSGEQATLAPVLPDSLISYKWTPNFNLSNDTIPNPITTTTSDTLYTLTYMDTLGCVGTINIFVDVKPVPLAGPDVVICEGGNIQLSASPGGIAYAWTLAETGVTPASLDDPTRRNPIAMPTDTTVYVVEVTYADSSALCPNTDTVVVFVNSIGFTDAGEDRIICPNDTIQLNAIGGNSYTWSPTIGLSNPNIANPLAFPTSTTTYQVVVNNTATGCSSMDNVTITVTEEKAPEIANTIMLQHCAKPFTTYSFALPIDYEGCEELEISFEAQLTNDISYENDSIHYTSAFNTSREDSVLIKACTNETNLCDSLLIRITYCDQQPSWPIDTLFVNTCKNVPIVLPLPTDIDPDGDEDVLYLTAINEDEGSSLVISNNNEITYTPVPNQAAYTDALIITACDSLFPNNNNNNNNIHCDDLVVMITVTPNELPETEPLISLLTRFDTPANTCFNATDLDGDSLIITPLHGTIPNLTFLVTSLDSTEACIEVTPDAGFSGDIIDTILVCDTCLVCDSIVFQITVEEKNEPPIGVDTMVTIPFGQETIICPNIIDPENDEIVITPVKLPSLGISSSAMNTCIGYTHNGNLSGLDTIIIAVCDDVYPTINCDTLTIFIEVEPEPNSPPIVQDINTQLTSGANSTVICLDITEPNNDELCKNSATSTPCSNIISTANADSVSFLPDGVTCLYYEPVAGFVGIDTLQVVICDVLGLCDTAQVVITSVPLPPIVEDTMVTTQTNEFVEICLDILDVADIDTISLNILEGPENGTITENDTCLTYIPNINFSGIETIEVQICGNFDNCTRATITIFVQNNPPTITNQEFEVTAGDSIAFCYTIIDPDNDPTNIVLTDGPFAGTVSLEQPNCVNYIANASYEGLDSIQIAACDPTQNCDVIWTVITVNPRPNTSPILDDTTITTSFETPIEFCLQIEDAENDTSIISAITNLGNGTLTGSSSNTALFNDTCLIYTPDNGFVGQEIVTLEVCDYLGECTNSTLIIEVLPPNNAPVITPVDIIHTLPNQQETVCLTATDIDDDALTFTIIEGNENASIIDNCVTFSAPSEAGIYQVLVEVCDDDTSPLCVQTTLTFVVHSLPIIENEAINGQFNTPTEVCLTVTGLNNDENYTITIVEDANNGNTIVGEDSCITYTPNSGFEGIETIMVEVCGEFGNCTIATVTINVSKNVIAVNDSIQLTQGNNVDINIILNDDFPSIDSLQITIVAEDDDNLFVENSSTIGLYTYLPTPDFIGIDTITYFIEYPNFGIDSAIVIIYVTQGITAQDDTSSLITGQSVNINLTANDSDPNTVGQLILTEILNVPMNGTVIITDANTIAYTSTLGLDGLDSLSYIVCNDFYNLCDTATVFINVLPITECKVKVYAAISPNGDGKNETFFIDGLDCDGNSENELIVFNRWGQMVFEESNYGTRDWWDGSFKGRILPNGTYYYLLKIPNKNMELTGFIEIQQ